MFLADAAIKAGQRDDARDIIAGLEPVAAATPSPMLHVHMRYARAVLADDADAPGHYAAVMAQDLARWPWAKARAELACGSWLRRQRKYGQSGEMLRAAQTTFRSIGADPWAARARAELAAALAREPDTR